MMVGVGLSSFKVVLTRESQAIDKRRSLPTNDGGAERRESVLRLALLYVLKILSKVRPFASSSINLSR